MRIVAPLVLVCLVASFGYAQQPPTPTKQHEYLKKDVGNWTGTMKMPVPGSDPVEMPVKETNTMLDGNLWLLSEFDAGPFQGRGQFGYDARKKKFVGTWIDNMNPLMSVMEGEYDVEKQKMVMTFTGIDHASGNTVEMKSVSTIPGKDKRNFVMLSKNGGNWDTVFEINYERAK